jgi:cation diffusion facilitator family transporter
VVVGGTLLNKATTAIVRLMDRWGRPAANLERRQLLRHAVRLATFTIAYNVVEGIVAIAAGWLAGSIALVGFGLDSSIETVSAVVVLLRLRAELRSREPGAHEAAERRAERLVGGTLFALCAYVLFESISTLVQREVPSASPVGIVLATLSLIVMPWLAVAKRRVGKALGSRALIADSTETLICSYLSFTLLLGLGLNAAFGWWWADPVAALIMVPLIFQEAREAWRGECCCDDALDETPGGCAPDQDSQDNR